MGDAGAEVLHALQAAGVERGSLVALALRSGPSSGLSSGLGLALVGREGDVHLAVDTDDPASVVALVDQELRPRWAMWSGDTALALVRAGVRVATSWDIAAVHRLLVGGWRADPARAWAWSQALPTSTIPAAAPVAPLQAGLFQPDLFQPDLFQPDLFQPDHLQPDLSEAELLEPDLASVGPDGHLRPAWVADGWSASAAHLERWAQLAAVVVERQLAALGAGEPTVAGATARSESAAELLCAEMTVDGLPMDRQVAEQVIAGFVGRRPRSPADAEELARARQAEVLQHLPGAPELRSRFDLRSPAQVKALLGLIGIDVPDTRAWRLETLRGSHPIIEPLLAWRKAERISTTYGYGWLDENLGADGRLRGAWTASDGAAGRMTASAGLHNMPAVMRQSVVAEHGHVFVRADLGQIEPRVLAAVSQDPLLAEATLGDDLYAPVAAQLGVDRATAKVAVLGAMYGQTTGHGARALRRLEAAYPVAMAYLAAGDRAGQRGEDLRTYGGRRIRLGSGGPDSGTGSGGGHAGDELDPVAGGDREARARAAARGRYGRNALIQGAAAELFKVWAVTVRARVAPLDSRVVLCLHDELLVHAPVAHGAEVARLLDRALQEAARRWAPDDSVRFVADISIIDRWSDAKV